VTFADDPPPLDGELRAVPLPPARRHDVAVLYDGADLDDIARAVRLPAAEVVRRHVAGSYRVLFIGFAPGFGYLGGLDPQLRCPRRPSPRPRVPAGAVAIADGYTAIYPAPSPGGWNLLGSLRGPLPELAPGDEVRFQVA
jgi:KipI family sensor histidine kinase inhibitor